MEKYDHFSREELIAKIDNLEELVASLMSEKNQNELFHFPWAGNLGNWYFHTKDNIVVYNAAKIKALGYSEDEMPEKVTYQFFTEKIHPEDYEKTMKNMKDHMLGLTSAYEISYRIRTKAGDWRWFYDRGTVTKRDQEGRPLTVAGIVFDITEQKAMEELLKEQNKKLIKLASTDHLTKLNNRKALFETLEYEIKEEKRNHAGLCILILDIDYFKSINDTYGHLIGDQVLLQTAEILKNSVRRIDTVGRYGGEEFLVILPGTNIQDAVDVAERIRKNVEEATFTDGIKVTVSGGLKQYDGEEGSSLICLADQQLYLAKEDGRNQIFY